MRVGIVALLHESNTFIAAPTTLKHFEDDLLLEGEAIRERLADSHHEIGGFFAGLNEFGIESVPIFVARAVPFGAITTATFQTLIERMTNAIDRAGALDGLLVAPHGATVCESIRDADGHWLMTVRKRLPDIPIIGTLDPHANLSRQMVAATDALVAYRSNPHLDQRARGIEAATLMARTLRGEIRPVQAAAMPPMAINIERQLTTEPHCVALYQRADEQLQRPGVLSNSVLLGFPYADVEEMGSAILTVVDGSRELAEANSHELAAYMWAHRNDFAGQFIGIDEALARCKQVDGPVCLLDMGDNVGGGSPADSTHLLHALRRHEIRRAFVCLYDPQVAHAAHQASIGDRLRLAVGGKSDHIHGQPFEDDFKLIGLFDGKFSEPQPRHGGFTHCDQGPTAVLEGDSRITVMVTSRRMPPFSLQQLLSCQVDPRSFQVLIAKGVNAPVAAYQPVCTHFIRVNTPGCTTADMTSLEFHHRRCPLFPFERELTWTPDR